MLIAVFVHYGSHLPQLKPAQATESSTAPSPDNEKMVTVVSPLEQWMGNEKPAQVTENRPARKPHPSDHIAPSPVGSSSVIVRKTFAISTSITFPFEIPAHAVNAQLHGNYLSFVGRQEFQAGDDRADVSFLLMNEQQYNGFMNGRSADVLVSLDPSHDQDVNFGLPASRDLPAKYYLVFRNDSREGRKIVKADFRVDF
jgi:hypothetical protein